MAFLNYRTEGMTGVIAISRPPANALSTEVLQELADLLTAAERDPNVRVLVIHGEGRFFSAGADIKEFTSVRTGSQFSEMSRRGQELFERMERFPKPIIAAIHGAALGGGLELAMACHIRVVSETAKLGLPELQLGIIPGFAGTQRLPKYVGAERALVMMLTSEPISGKEAAERGLAAFCFPEEKLLEETMKLAKKIEKKSPQSIKAVIELANFAKTGQFYEGMKKEAELFGQIAETGDAKEGIQAFLEKREPNFTGE